MSTRTAFRTGRTLWRVYRHRKAGHVLIVDPGAVTCSTCVKAAAPAPESLRVRVAWALEDAAARTGSWDSRMLADAAIAAICTPVEGAPVGAGDPAAAVVEVGTHIVEALAEAINYATDPDGSISARDALWSLNDDGWYLTRRTNPAGGAS